MEGFIERTDRESEKHKNQIVTEFGEDQVTHNLENVFNGTLMPSLAVPGEKMWYISVPSRRDV